ncbi:helix-turn-helix domain-containing protein [Companilactobacillus halodurans]|uniref:Helix-turn-helix transcriptional regulator n=1 Tax=Companilactobacillus halodurans TaxID=2584183 RepID=A0A5P0ZXX6_9LACO|nr:helix-turn-helix transcriptional regulator [Companilactobacillus halodurans]MQS97870.1 helix-turn-helix transcriptional regulator [Companilactobacillus halodurans]
MDNLGDILKETRQQRQLSQLEIATDICSQSTLSEIEHNKYIPNMQLLINICQRLSIDLYDLSLVNSFKICKDNYSNAKINRLYSSRNYQALQNFLNRPTVIELVQTSKQTQAYYYYLAICALHLENKFDNAKELLKLSLASTEHNRKQTVLSRIGNITLAYVYSRQGLKNSAYRQISLAFKKFDRATYDENLNVVFYLASLSYYELSKYDLAIKMIENGIDFIQENESHSMLLNSFLLMANIAEAIKNEPKNVPITKEYHFFNNFLHERNAYRSNELVQ